MNCKGFTLIETMVAMVILVIGIVAAMQMNIMYVQANTFNNQLSEATVLAQEKMEELRSYARSDRTDRHSALDFDYLVSTSTGFSSLFDPTAAAGTGGVAFAGLLSGTGDTCTGVKLPWNTNPDPTAYDFWRMVPSAEAPVHGANVYECEQDLFVTGTATTRKIIRRWLVEPLPRLDDGGNVATDPDGNTIFDYAILTVETKWTDRFNAEHSVELTSLVGRKQ